MKMNVSRLNVSFSKSTSFNFRIETFVSVVAIKIREVHVVFSNEN